MMSPGNKFAFLNEFGTKSSVDNYSRICTLVYSRFVSTYSLEKLSEKLSAFFTIE